MGAVALGLIAVIGTWSLCVGDFPIPVGDALEAVAGRSASDSDATFIVGGLRLPRVVTAVLVGAALGMSGQTFQRLVRNPLASPDILGVSAGAAVGAVACLVLTDAGRATVTGCALLGAVATVGVIYVLAVRDGVSSYRLVLIGIGVTAMLGAVVAYLLTRADLLDARRATVWLTGSLNGRGWEYVRPLSLVLAVLGPVGLTGARRLRALELGDETATGLGVSVVRAKLALALSGAGLAAVATAAAGPVGFVALVAPQVSRRLTSERSTGLVTAGLVGAVIVVAADLVARRAFAPIELPVGVVTAVIGAPYLLWLLARTNRAGAGG